MQYLPIFMDIKNKPILVVGGGEVASRKVDLLLSAQASVTVISPVFNTTLQRYGADNKVTLIHDYYDAKYLTNYVMTWVTTDNLTVNKQVWADCDSRNILVNVADQQDLCQFITPSIIDRSPLQIAISSGGNSPVLIRYIREKLEAVLPASLGTLGDFSGTQRDVVQTKFTTLTERRRFWERFFSSDALDVADDPIQLEASFTRQLNTPLDSAAGDIYLISPVEEADLLTLRSLRFMQQSDVIIYADDVSMDLIELCRRDAERLPLAKALHVEHARERKIQGERVCIIVNSAQEYQQLKMTLTDAKCV